MTIEVHAVVRRFPRVGGTPLGEPWLALVYTTSGPEDTGADCYEASFNGSMPEAVQATYKMRERLTEQLMREVHESRSTRRPFFPLRDFPVNNNARDLTVNHLALDLPVDISACDCSDCDAARAFVEATA